jgi:hypothetical protein
MEGGDLNFFTQSIISLPHLLLISKPVLLLTKVTDVPPIDL